MCNGKFEYLYVIGFFILNFSMFKYGLLFFKGRLFKIKRNI